MQTSCSLLRSRLDFRIHPVALRQLRAKRLAVFPQCKWSRLAHRVISRQRTISVALGAKQTLSRIYEYSPTRAAHAVNDRCMKMPAFPDRILHFCDRADRRVAANINQPVRFHCKLRSMPVVVGPSRHVGPQFTFLALHMSPAPEYNCLQACGRCSPRTAGKYIGAGGAGTSR